MLIKSIRTKLTVWYSLVVGTTLVAFGLTAYYFTRETLSENLDRSLKNEVRWLNEILEKKLPRKKYSARVKSNMPVSPPADSAGEKIEPSDEVWNQIYEHTLLNPKKQFIQITDPRGKIIYKSYNLSNDSLSYAQVPYFRTQLVNVVGTNNLQLRLAEMQNEHFRIFVAYPLAELTDVIENLFSIFLILIPIAIIVSIVGGWFLAYKSLKPVDNITTTARRITAQNLDQQIPERGVDDEMGRLTSTLNDMIARLRNSFEQIKQFSVDASHELRTPLTIMRGEVELALRSKKSPEEYQRILSSNLDEILRMSAIIDNLLTLSKADLGKADLNFEQVNLHHILNELYQDSEILASRKNIKVELAKVDDVTLIGDKVRLRQLLLNLIDNAIKFTPEHGRVYLSLERSNGQARIIVSDTGIGIPTEEQGKIFDRFYRVEKGRSREMGGSGLGLSIAKWIAEAHRGSIEVVSEPKKGSQFTVKLPLDSRT